MEKRQLGKTDIQSTALGFGASSLGAEFRNVDLNECLQSVHVAMEVGMNFIDTSPYYGRGMSEVMLGRVLPEIPRDSYTLCTKLGRYAPAHFDFSAKRCGCHGNRHAREQIGAIALEELMLLDGQENVEITRRSATHTAFAFIGKSNTRAVFDTGRNVD